MNQEEDLYRIIREVASESTWNFDAVFFEKNDVLSPGEYHDILSSCSDSFEIWQTIYHHVLPSHMSLIEWVRATRLRLYFDILEPEEQEEFENQILQRAKSAYPFTRTGEVIFPFKRLFFLAWRGREKDNF